MPRRRSLSSRIARQGVRLAGAGQVIGGTADQYQREDRVSETPAIYQATSGHGHVIPRRDGVKARCGGPALCSVCAREKARMDAVHQQRQADETSEPVCIDCKEVGHHHVSGRCRVVFEEHGGLRECECDKPTEENRIDQLRQALHRSGVDWPTIHRLDDIRANLAPEVQGPGDCSNCNEHVLLALVDRLTSENAALRAAAIGESGYLDANEQPVDYWCRLCEARAAKPDAIHHADDCPMGDAAGGGGR